MPDALALILGAAAALVTLASASGVLWWLVGPRLQQWAQEQLIEPIKETRDQVTVNGGKSDPPTILDKVGGIAEDVSELRTDVAELRADYAGLARQMGEHLGWSDEWTEDTSAGIARIEARLLEGDQRFAHIEDLIEHHHPEGDTP